MDDSPYRNRARGSAGNMVSNQLRRRNDRSSIPEGVFKPKPTSSESKADTTTKTARSIISAEMAAREAKTERLRQARLTREAEAAPATNAKPPSSRKKSRP